MTRDEAIEILDTIPTIGEQVDALDMAIEALERKHGEWIYDGLTFENDSLYKCSICCHRVPMEYGEMKFYSYCPNCGADMRGDND